MPKTVTCKSAPETNRQGAIFLASVNSSFKSRSKKAVYLYKICFRIANHDASNFSMINFGEDDQTRMFDVFRPILPFFLPAIRDVQNYLRIFSRILTPCPPLYTFITFWRPPPSPAFSWYHTFFVRIRRLEKYYCMDCFKCRKIHTWKKL